ncbi:MAG: anaerobic ribonucleoside-triphosphate reductase activating protein [Hydrogenibacillus schlegelii]|uniref:Anaerobic ribonucleoside-triphosphate reductase activating protein n=1 Tax=Hydrogenibacillus schlegelii TaxID=1484 RepID=A0A947CX77_HYDSH|nr:anaerobic ribonucleoside-triphosphate reductase activating protein [Hydrogenibacillus schlegelii]
MFYDLLPLSLLDDPGHLAATVFTSGCRFRCPFCHNALLQRVRPPKMPPQTALRLLAERRGRLESVAVTGGEPTLWKDLPDFLAAVKALGYRVKLDTAGDRPDALADLLARGLVDFVAMDVKDAPERYGRYAPDPRAPERVRTAAAVLRESGVPYEIRITVTPKLHEDEAILRAVRWIGPVPRLVLQAYRPAPGVMAPEIAGTEPTPPDRLRRLRARILAEAPAAATAVELRGG